MEHGRWHFTSAQFASGASPSEWKMRREIKASVMRSRSAGHVAALDQSALWARVDQELASADVRSSTADYHELVERRMGEAASVLARVRPVGGQVGLLALIDGLLVAIDLVGSSATWRHLAERALRSLLPAASDPEASASRPDARRLSAGEWLRLLAASRPPGRHGIGRTRSWSSPRNARPGTVLARGLTVLDLRTMVSPAKRRGTGETVPHHQERLVRPQEAIAAAARGSWSDALTRATIVRDMSTVICLGRHPPRRTATEPPARAGELPLPRGLDGPAGGGAPVDGQELQPVASAPRNQRPWARPTARSCRLDGREVEA